MIVSKPEELKGTGPSDVFIWVTPICEPFLMGIVREVEELVKQARMNGMVILHVDQTHANARARTERGY